MEPDQPAAISIDPPAVMHGLAAPPPREYDLAALAGIAVSAMTASETPTTAQPPPTPAPPVDPDLEPVPEPEPAPKPKQDREAELEPEPAAAEPMALGPKDTETVNPATPPTSCKCRSEVLYL